MATPQQASRKSVTVRYVAGGRRFVKTMLVPASQIASWVVNASGVVPLHPELMALQEAGKLAFGNNGKVLSASHVPADGEILDVYLPALAARRKA